MAFATLDVKLHPPSGTIVFRRADRRNAISSRMLSDLEQAFSDLHQHKPVRAVILTGEGAAFSSGADLTELSQTQQEEDPFEAYREGAAALQSLLETMLRFPKPIIAALHGPAFGAGAAIALACDAIVATRDASIGLPEARRGLAAGHSATLLAFRAGAAVAARVALTGDALSAERALACGLFHEIVEERKLWAASHSLVERIAEKSPEALAIAKRLLNETIGEEVFAQLSAASAAVAAARTTESARLGVAAFLKKTDPEWK